MFKSSKALISKILNKPKNNLFTSGQCLLLKSNNNFLCHQKFIKQQQYTTNISNRNNKNNEVDYLTSESISLGVNKEGTPLAHVFQKPMITYQEYLTLCSKLETNEVELTDEIIKDLYFYIKFDKITNLFTCSRHEIETVFKYALLNCYRFNNPLDRVLCAQSLLDKLMEIIFNFELKNFDMKVLEGNISLKPEDVIPIVFHDLDIYTILIDVYSSNGFQEQVFELFELMKKHFSILFKLQNDLLFPSTSSKEELDREKQLKNTKGKKLSGKDRDIEDLNVLEEEEKDEELAMIAAISSNNKGVDGSGEENEKLSELDSTDEDEALVTNFPLFKETKVYNQLIDGCAQIGRLKDVQEIINFMIANKIEVTTDTLNKSLMACINQGANLEALKFLDLLVNNGAKPDNETCRILLRISLEANDMNNFKDIYEGLKNLLGEEFNEDAMFLEYFKCLCFVTRETQFAFELLLKKQDVLKEPIIYYNVLLEACVNVRDKLTALKAMEVLLKQYNDSVLSESIEEEGKEEVSKEEEETKENNSPKTLIVPNAETFNYLLRTLSSDGDARTIDLYHHFRSNYKEIFTPNTNTYNAIIQAVVMNGELAKAKKLVKEMREYGLKPDVSIFNQLFYGYYKNDWENHMKEFREKDAVSVFKAHYKHWEVEQQKLREEATRQELKQSLTIDNGLDSNSSSNNSTTTEEAFTDLFNIIDKKKKQEVNNNNNVEEDEEEEEQVENEKIAAEKNDLFAALDRILIGKQNNNNN
ncbi:hypothetical protein ABK040_011082 [Willaertia magna]